MNSLVSVVIPTYNRAPDIIIEAINSVKCQSYKEIEIIVVDDNGEKNPELSKNIESNITDIEGVRYIKHNSNQGACAARNTGIINSNGEFVAFLDDDDIWKPEKTEKQIRLFEDSGVGLVYCGIEVIYTDEKKKVERKATKKKKVVEELLKHNYIGSTSCGIARKSALIECGLFDVNLKSGQDQDMWIRLAQKYKVDCVEECLIGYVRNPNDSSISKTKRNRLDSNLYLRKKYDDIFSKNLSLRVLMNLKIIKAYWVNGLKKEAFEYIIGKRE